MFIERETMPNKARKEIIKATIETIIVAFLYVIIFFIIIISLFKNELTDLKSIVNLISINTNNKILENVKLDLTTKNLESYPEYGTKYANLKIPSLNIDLPVYYGDTLSILKHGVGHSSGSYFPGEGGRILYMAHNTSDMLKNLKDILIDAEIIVETTYGTYTYKVYDKLVINYKDLSSVPINREEEVLMLYTCYNSLTIGHTEQRFITYAKLEKEELKGEY